MRGSSQLAIVRPQIASGADRSRYRMRFISRRASDTESTISPHTSISTESCAKPADRIAVGRRGTRPVANHVSITGKAVNGALETLLIPSASNAELKSLLQTGLKIFQGHQQHAEHVAAALK